MFRPLIIFSVGLALAFAGQDALAESTSPESADQQEKVLVIPSYDADDPDVILASHRRYYNPRPYRYYYRPPYRYYGDYYRPYPYRAYRPSYYGPYPHYGYRYYYDGPGVYYYGPHVQFRIEF